MVSTNTTRACALYQKIAQELAKAVIGKDDIKEALMLALIAGGHLLIEGSPGSGKTKLASAFAETIGLTFKRIQFTPDMLPADVTGFEMYSPDGKSGFVEGPIFAGIVLADELNRTTPRTQSALLEAMQEHQVTVDRRTYTLPEPFMVVATQVEAGGEGTYPLTDVQSDRFMLRVLSRRLTKEEEMAVICGIDKIDAPDIRPVTDAAEILQVRDAARQVHVVPEIAEYIVSILNSLRADPDLSAGPGTRAGIALYKCSRARALLDGRDYVIPDDVKSLAPAVIEHRLKLKPESEMDDLTPSLVLSRTLNSLEVPKI